MDFFEAQDRAKQATWKLLGLYLAAVILIILSVYIVAIFALGYAGAPGMREPWQPGLFFTVTIFTIILIVSGTLFRISQLRKGGSAVAEMLGGRKLEASSREPNERQLINIVEEMSIASGLPMPEIYVLDNEENINAFAAGFGTDDAAVGVTKGALEQLNRDELQGVIAHEFSHIFNGDMRLNIRLIGILNGILLIHITGMLLMRSTFFMGGGRRSSRNNNDGGKSTIVILLLGIALIVIGYIGMMFGRMIQAAVSRQREYLADAAAVQYTRNPDGIAGALAKIGRVKKGAEIKDGHAMEFSHMFFANSFHTALDKLFATHPPLDKRIQAIQPGFEPKQVKKKERIDERLNKDRVEQQKQPSAGGPLSETLPIQEILLGAIGTMDNRGMSEASNILNEIPDELREAAHEPFQAEALIYALLISSSDRVAKDLPDWSRKILSDEQAKQITLILPKLLDGKREWSVPLAEISIPALRQMSESQYGLFRQNIKNLVEHDNEVSLFEFAIEKLIEHRLDQHFRKEKSEKIRHHHLKTIGEELSIVLSSLANTSDAEPKKAWQTGVDILKQAAPDNVKYLAKDEYNFDDIDKALNELSSSANPVKRYLIKSMIHCVLADDKLSLEELELLRAMGEVIGVPIPLHVRPR